MAMVKPMPSSPTRLAGRHPHLVEDDRCGRTAPQTHLVLVGGHLDAPVGLDHEAADPPAAGIGVGDGETV